MSCSEFRQQRLPAWQPLLSPLYVAGLMALVALVFLPIGGVIALMNRSTQDKVVRYDDISPCAMDLRVHGVDRWGKGQSYLTGCHHLVSFELFSTMKAPIFLYYGLEGFFQNHRRYSYSKSDAQLAGQPVPPHRLHSLSPLATPGELTGTANTGIRVGHRDLRYADLMYAPAGLIPWSMFNDTFVLYRIGRSLELICNGSAFSRFTNEPIDTDGREVPSHTVKCHKKGIAWATDVSHKYKPLHFPPEEATGGPIVWSARRDLYPGAPALASNDTFFNNGWYAGEVGHPIPVTTDEDLMVWSRVASMPNFRKLHRVIDVDMPAGKYVMNITEHFDVSSFNGKKSFILATLSPIGGKNKFLAYLYVVLGVVAAVSCVVFVLLHKVYSTRAETSIAMLVAE